jgi:exopolysaccharide production protein ExoZ
MARIQSLQVLRFFAALGVVWLHSAHAVCLTEGRPIHALGLIPEIGATGVDVFFVISGFIIASTGPLAVPRPSAAAFLWRRFSRVAPLYFLLSLPAMTMAGDPNPALAVAAHGPISAAQLAATFVFWPALGPTVSLPYLLVGWTLGFEMLFYLLVGATVMTTSPRRSLLIAAGILAAVLMAREITNSLAAHVLTNSLMLEFGLGVGLAVIWPRLKSLPLSAGIISAVYGVAGLVAGAIYFIGPIDLIATIADRAPLVRFLEFGVPAALLVAGALILEAHLRGPVVKALANLGDASYCLYLVHPFVLLALVRTPDAGRLDPGLAVVAALAASILPSLLVYHFIEKPLLAAVRHIGRRRQSLATATPQFVK